MKVALKANRCVLLVFIFLALFDVSAEARIFRGRFRRPAPRFVPRFSSGPRFMPAPRSCGGGCGVVRRPAVNQGGDVFLDDRGINDQNVPLSGVLDPSDGSAIQDDVFGPDGAIRGGNTGGRSLPIRSGGTCGVPGGSHSGSCGVVGSVGGVSSPRPVIDDSIISPSPISDETIPPTSPLSSLVANSAGEHPIGGIINPAASRPITPEQVAPVEVPKPEPKPGEPLVCSDPKKAICGDPSTRGEEEKQIAAKRQQTMQLALTAARVTADTLQSGEALNILAYRSYLFGLQRLVETRSPVAAINDVRTNMRQAIRLSAPPELQGAMIAKLDSIRYLSFSQLAFDRPEYLQSFILTCGPDGLSNNAAYFEEGPDRIPTKVLCPAYLSQEAKPEDLFGTIAHEDGHAIDNSRFPNLFTGLLACYRDKYKGFSRDLAGEATADFWMQQTIAVKFAGSNNAEKLLSFAKVALGDYCLPGPRFPTLKYPQGVQQALTEIKNKPRHPSSDFRIDAFARNPQIRRVFGCTGETSTGLAGGAPGCGLSGAL